MALRPRSMALSILYHKATVYAVAYIIHSRYNFRGNLFYLYEEEGPASAIREGVGIFIVALVYNLPVFASNYYFARGCFKERIHPGEMVINILIMASCNILYLIIMYRVVTVEPFASLSFILAGIVIAATLFMEFLRYKISARKPA